MKKEFIEEIPKTPEFCEPPGIREGGGVQLYLAYLVDPSGNKICAMYESVKIRLNTVNSCNLLFNFMYNICFKKAKYLSYYFLS